ncbi:MAG TPA: hypothetical protein VKA36_04855 [Solirubrobacterales bacterium]|nr:hypothetical protein [Solirubrobacterales bacterium]
MELALAILIIAAVAAFVAVPFRRGADGEATATVSTADPAMADLEARKQAKYREIRDAELDHAQGKLGEAEFARQNAELRAEAIEILRRIDELAGESAGDGAAERGGAGTAGD